ncbi:hypothetical protein KY285_020547 [Solanum tuberosum]|nr:hypothetical protein KY285_020547 [Solanum tuberosum]
MSGEMSNFPGNQEVGVEMVKDMSSLGLLHSWSSSGVLDEVYVLLHQAQLGGTGVAPQVQPPLGMYPHPPPWKSYTPPYMIKRRGSQVPLVSIPKLKPQAVLLAPKSSKKVQKKKSEVKLKKVASVSFLGVLFFMLLFSGLVPLLKVRYGDHNLHCGWGDQGESNQKNTNKVAAKFVHVGNGSDSLAASLYVPSNDKLVDIHGNSIIQSIFAIEKAMASHRSADAKNSKASLAVPGDLALDVPGIHPFLYRSPAAGQRTLGSEEKERQLC